MCVGIHKVDNTWVVPYNPYLSKKFNAHINVEACTSIKSVKYLFKYVYKGHDCANVEVRVTDEYNLNEVTRYLDARYVSAPEAFWRLSEFSLHKQSHAVIRLPVHLPEGQGIIHQAGREEEALRDAAVKDTMLTAYLSYNAEHHTDLCYSQFPTHYVFNHKKREWKPRQRGGHTIIPRLYSASPKDSERYCLRLLLHHVPGATEYQDLRTVDGRLLPTFKEACIQRHLLSNDREWENALQEAAAIQMPSQLRSLFATICIHCEPTNPLQLWDAHKESMTEDFLHRHHVTVETAEQMALYHIELNSTHVL